MKRISNNNINNKNNNNNKNKNKQNSGSELDEYSEELVNNGLFTNDQLR